MVTTVNGRKLKPWSVKASAYHCEIWSYTALAFSFFQSSSYTGSTSLFQMKRTHHCLWEAPPVADFRKFQKIPYLKSPVSKTGLSLLRPTSCHINPSGTEKVKQLLTTNCSLEGKRFICQIQMSEQSLYYYIKYK